MEEKTAVCVDVHCEENGTLIPEKITWTNGRVYNIDNILSVTVINRICRRFDISISGRRTSLYFETTPHNRFGPGFWYVRRKES